MPASCVENCSSVADPKTLRVTGRIGGSSILPHGVGQDIHLSRSQLLSTVVPSSGHQPAVWDITPLGFHNESLHPRWSVLTTAAKICWSSVRDRWDCIHFPQEAPPSEQQRVAHTALSGRNHHTQSACPAGAGVMAEATSPADSGGRMQCSREPALPNARLWGHRERSHSLSEATAGPSGNHLSPRSTELHRLFPGHPAPARGHQVPGLGFGMGPCTVATASVSNGSQHHSIHAHIPLGARATHSTLLPQTASVFPSEPPALTTFCGLLCDWWCAAF